MFSDPARHEFPLIIPKIFLMAWSGSSELGGIKMNIFSRWFWEGHMSDLNISSRFDVEDALNKNFILGLVHFLFPDKFSSTIPF